MRGEEQGRAELNETRERVGLPPLDHVHGGISRELALVATFPQLEYRARWPQPGMRVIGPLLWEQPFGEVELPPGDEPLVLVAPSTSQDPTTGSCEPPSRGWPGSRCGCWRPPTGATRRSRSRAHRTRAWSTGSPTRDDAHAPRWSATPATGPSPERSRAACPWWPARTRRHGRERGPHPLGRRGRVAAAPLHTPRGVRLAVARLLAEPSYGRRAAELGPEALVRPATIGISACGTVSEQVYPEAVPTELAEWQNGPLIATIDTFPRGLDRQISPLDELTDRWSTQSSMTRTERRELSLKLQVGTGVALAPKLDARRVELPVHHLKREVRALAYGIAHLAESRAEAQVRAPVRQLSRRGGSRRREPRSCPDEGSPGWIRTTKN